MTSDRQGDDRAARLAAIEARVRAATPGPWMTRPDLTGIHITAGNSRLMVARASYGVPAWLPADQLSVASVDANADLIANAPSDLPWLCDEVRRLERALGALVSAEDAGCLDVTSMAGGCVYCDASMLRTAVHKPDCPILAGRRALGMEAAP